MAAAAGYCWLCRQYARTLHEHHVTMRALTQELGPKVDLCGGCHTDIHAIATARSCILKGGKSKAIREWPYNRSDGEVHRAETLIQALVRVLLSIDSSRLPKTITLEVPASINAGLAMLKQDWGLKNKRQVVLACVTAVLKAKGLLNHL